MVELLPLIHRMTVGLLVGVALVRPLLEWFFRDGHDREWAAYAHSLLLQMDFGAPVLTVILMATGVFQPEARGELYWSILPVQLVVFVVLLFTSGILNSPILRQREHLAHVLATTRLSTAQLHQLSALNRRQNVLIPIQLGLILLVALLSAYQPQL